MTIGIVSHPADDHAAAVARALHGAGWTPRLIDLADFPSAICLTFEVDGAEASASLRIAGQEVHLDDLGVTWWRRPKPYALDSALDPSVASFAYSECHEAMAGTLHSLRTQWVNPPAADELAHHKPLQLAAARKVGLPVPRTLITNDPEAALAFVEEQGPRPTIYKTFLAHESHWRETRVMTRRELEVIDSVRLAPVIFQEFIEADADVRVTLFGDEILAAEILSPPDAYRYDYRVGLDAVTMRPVSLPEPVGTALLELTRALGLVYGAADLRRCADGRFVFLEINPAGEFLFIEQRSGLPLTAAMASLLKRLDGQG